MSDVDDTPAVQTEAPTAVVPRQTKDAAGQGSTDALSVFRDPPEREIQPSETVYRVPQHEAPGSGAASVEELARFLVGVLIWGGDELLQRVHEVQEDLAANPEVIADDQNLDQESTAALLRYLTVGLVMRGQRRAVEGARQGVYFTLGAASWWADKVNRWSDNRFMRPIRRPIAARMQNWRNEAGQLIREGRHEEQAGRVLATATIQEIMYDLIDEIATDPELAVTIQGVIGKKTRTIATGATDNARSASVVADNITEQFVRRLMRRAPRSDLPPSPVYGKKQTMYEPKDPAQESEKYGG